MTACAGCDVLQEALSVALPTLKLIAYGQGLPAQDIRDLAHSALELIKDMAERDAQAHATTD
jgi:hypothetical protein